jgi:hypothetical protein
MIKGLPLVEQSYKRNLEKTTPPKVNPFIIPDFSYKTAPPKVNPFIIPDFSYKTAPPKVNLLSFQISLIRLLHQR